MKKIEVAILGATGAVGQRFIQLLQDHPWFEVAELVGGSSAGSIYGEVVRWVLDDNPPANVMKMRVKALDSVLSSPIVFSALPKEAATDCELRLASAGHLVCTNASSHRMAPDVPLLLPEVNADHLRLLDVQRANRGWSGGIVANSNCTVMPVVMSLAPLLKYGVEKIHMVSEQAVSGAGYPGVASLDIIDNIIPYVGGDEDKMETESLKMLGQLEGSGITPLKASASATCTRVPVIDGHLVTISLAFRHTVSCEEIIETWQSYETSELIRGLPSAPSRSIQYLEQNDRPQPRRDRNAGRGMTTSIGRLRLCPVLGFKFVALTHNTIRGAAGSSILNAELLRRLGYLDSFMS